MHGFFFSYKKQTAEHFEAIFNEGSEGSDKFSERWGWYPLLYTLADEQLLKIDAVTEMGAKVVFSHLAFLKDLAFKQKNDNVQ